MARYDNANAALDAVHAALPGSDAPEGSFTNRAVGYGDRVAIVAQQMEDVVQVCGLDRTVTFRLRKDGTFNVDGIVARAKAMAGEHAPKPTDLATEIVVTVRQSYVRRERAVPTGTDLESLVRALAGAKLPVERLQATSAEALDAAITTACATLRDGVRHGTCPTLKTAKAPEEAWGDEGPPYAEGDVVVCVVPCEPYLNGVRLVVKAVEVDDDGTGSDFWTTLAREDGELFEIDGERVETVYEPADAFDVAEQPGVDPDDPSTWAVTGPACESPADPYAHLRPLQRRCVDCSVPESKATLTGTGPWLRCEACDGPRITLLDGVSFRTSAECDAECDAQLARLAKAITRIARNVGVEVVGLEGLQ